MSVTVTGAYRFALDPTPVQERDLLSHAGAARMAFNWGLALVKAVMEQRMAERSGIAEPDLTPPVGCVIVKLAECVSIVTRSLSKI